MLKKNFNRTPSNKNVHVLDPFTGIGTFITWLIQSGLILAKKICFVNISANCTPTKLFCSSIILPLSISKMFFPRKWTAIDPFLVYSCIEIIVGNMPYSVRQKSANDNNQNQTYSSLEDRIGATYAAKIDAANKNFLHDSYIKAFRWTLDRIDERIISFVINAGWLDSAAPSFFIVNSRELVTARDDWAYNFSRNGLEKIFEQRLIIIILTTQPKLTRQKLFGLI